MAKKRPKAQSSTPSALVLRAIEQDVNQKAHDLIENVLKPKHIQPPPKGHQLNYLVDITTKWLGSKCYFVSIYACPGPNALSPTFEAKFARLEHIGGGKFNLAFMRHTGKWVELFTGLPLDECLKAVAEDPWFVP